MTKFIFDLDGTVTKQETLPLISKHFNIQDEIDNLTMETVKGNIPFIESSFETKSSIISISGPFSDIGILIISIPNSSHIAKCLS